MQLIAASTNRTPASGNGSGMTTRTLLVALTVVGLGCGSEPDDLDDSLDPTDRASCTARAPGNGAIVVHYGALAETNPSAAFLDALAGDSETVIVTRALTPDCGSGSFAHWRNKGDRFRWAYKLPDDEAAPMLSNDTFVGFVQKKIDQGWDYVAIDEIGANPGAPVDWKNGSEVSDAYVDALAELSDTGYGRRMLPYLASSTVSNPMRSASVKNVLQTIPGQSRIGLVELYRRTSDGHSVEQHRAYFHDKTRNLELAVGGINDHLITVLGFSNKNGAAPHRYLDVPSEDLASITRQFSALHQNNSLTRRHPGVGTYTWGATRHWDGHYSVYELAAHVRGLSDWYAAKFGVDAPGPGGPSSSPPEPPPPGPVCDEPNEKLVGAQCVPSCGFAGGNTCLGAGNHACDPYGALTSYDCEVCCARPDGLTIYRSYHPTKRSHKYALSEADASAGGYGLEGAVFSIARDGGGTRAPLHQCLKNNGRLFYTTSTDCEGAGQNHGALGYVGQAPEPGTRPLHRLYHSGNGAHFYAATDADRDAAVGLGYVYEGVQGYVW